VKSLVTANRFLGCVLGHALGDAMGAPYEGMPPDTRFDLYGPASKLFETDPDGILQYTDDTQMTIGVIETLLECGTIDENVLVRNFAKNYDPKRCYGQGARKVLEAMQTGGDWRMLAATIYPGGSLGNGAAMRVAPIGLVFGDDQKKVFEQAAISARVTHLHPIGIHAAQLLALAVGIVSRQETFNRIDFYDQLIDACEIEELAWQLRSAAELRPHQSILFGNSLEAHRSVISSIACFATTPNSYPDAICRAISLGDDTDTLAAMTGALSGALLGVEAIPNRLLQSLEDDIHGKSYITTMTEKLYERYAAISSIEENSKK
jgi:poly(ADP-ribose) glycohydrolase ARH3